MWFRFPKDVTQISVQQQLFVPEIEDAEGHGLFRAPDHFAAIILDQPGFSVPGELPKDAPEDLPKSLDLEVSNEVAALAGQLRQKDFEIANLSAKISELSMERDALSLELRETKIELANLIADNEEGKKKPSPTHEGVKEVDDKKLPPTELEKKPGTGFADSASSREKK